MTEETSFLGPLYQATKETNVKSINRYKEHLRSGAALNLNLLQNHLVLLKLLLKVMPGSSPDLHQAQRKETA